METLYYTKSLNDSLLISQNIRWLTLDDYDIFCKHLKLCRQQPLQKEKWEEAYANGIVYCGLFDCENMISRACVEKYSQNAWEISDVRTAHQYRENGYAHQVCLFILKYILQQGKTATIRTEETNHAMKKVISDLNFSIL